VLEKLTLEAGGEFVLARVNVDHAPGLASAYAVQGIPAVKAFRDGEPVLEFVGALPESQVREFLHRIVPSQADRLVKEAQALEPGDPARAESLYRQALSQDPNNTAAVVGLARLLIGRGQIDDEVRKLLDRARAGEQAAEVERLDAIVFLRQAARGLGSEESLRARLEAEPDNAELRYQLGLVLAAAGRYSEALEMLLSAAQRDKKLAAGKVREAMVKIFYAVGVRSPLADEYRAKLTRILY
jgi:putative thioredoxin